MSMSDLLSDSLTRLRNAQLSKHPYAVVNSSKLVEAVLKVLKKEGYIEDFQKVEKSKGINVIKVDLKYYQGEPVMNSIKRISKPGRRVYKSVENMPRSQGGLGVVVLSTSKGVMSDYEALNLHIGGEVLCEVC
jgi:small subunit ribosomal protein S8